MTMIETGNARHPEIFEMLTPHQRDALALVAAIHDGRDRDTWGGLRYWDQLVERVKLGRIGGPNLADWWSDVATRMGVVLWPSNRAAVTEIIQRNDPAVLEELVGTADYLVGGILRLCVDAQRAEKKKPETNDEELPL